MKNQILIFVLAACMASACAVPVPPSGGPPDKKPPELVRSSPESGTTGFSGRDLEFEFDEAVDLRSFTRAFSLTPDINGAPLITGSGKRIRIRLPEDPRPETTYIVSLDATLRDMHSVVLTKPITVAFSTGNQIDTAKMSGKVVRVLDGQPLTETDVFAYADNDSLTLTKAPLYRTQTDKTGEFLFEYVASGGYFVVAVQDRNQNRIIDPGESYGVPPVHKLQADSVAVSPETPWIVSVRDTTPPTLERVRAVTPTELELRFSEPLLTDLNDFHFQVQTSPNGLNVWDSLGTLVSPLSMYIKENRSRTLFAQTKSLNPGSYEVRGGNPASDSSQSGISKASLTFVVPENLPASTTPEFMMWVPDSAVVNTTTARPIWYRESAGFRTTVPIDTLLGAVLRDTSGTLYDAHFVQREGNFFVLEKKGSFGFNQPFFIDINQREFGGPDSMVSGLFRYATDREMGDLSFSVLLQPNDTKLTLYSELFVADDRSAPFAKWITRATSPEIAGEPKPIVIEKIPGGKRIFLRLYQTWGPDGWWGGELSPWIPPDPIAWVEIAEPIRARWETALPDTIDFRSWPLHPSLQK